MATLIFKGVGVEESVNMRGTIGEGGGRVARGTSRVLKLEMKTKANLKDTTRGHGAWQRGGKA